jgi:hypothetical protein
VAEEGKVLLAPTIRRSSCAWPRTWRRAAAARRVRQWRRHP